MAVNNDTEEVQIRKVSNFLNHEVKDFARYVVETRALPNIVDGLRPGARKIIWAALKGDLNKKALVKMPTLIGNAMGLHYNHGDAALMNTVVQLSSVHVNRYSPLEVHGQIGTLRVPDCDTAPRYLHIRRTPYIDFYTVDSELLEIQVEDGDKIEPKHFLPIVPITLLYRTNSPGFGFSFRAFSYDMDSIVDNCIKAINSGTCIDIDEIPLIPTVHGIKPENMIFNANKESWYSVGEYSTNFDNDTLMVTELPYDISFDKFDNHLNTLIEKGYIKGYTDLTVEGKIKYVIEFASGRLSILYNDKWKFFQSMKLFSKIKKNTLNCLDSDGKTILFFDTPHQLIDMFVKRRLEFYTKRKTKTIKHLEELISELSDKIRFIRLVVNDELIINKRKIADIKLELDGYKLSHTMLKINIDKLTKEEIEKMENDIIEHEKYLNYIKTTPEKIMYIKDLVEFKQKYCDIIKK